MFDFLKKITDPFKKAAQSVGYFFGASEREQEERRKREEEERRRQEAKRREFIEAVTPDSVEQAAESAKKTVGDFFAAVPDKVRVRDVVRELPGSAEKVRGGILDFGKAILRAIPRAAGSVTLSAQDRKELIPETPAEKFLFGEETLRDVRGTGEETIEAFGGSKETAGKYGLPLGVALTSLDLIPGLPKKKIAQEVGEQLVKRYGDDIAKLIVQKGGKKLAEKALKEGGEKAVEKAGIKMAQVGYSKLAKGIDDAYRALEKTESGHVYDAGKVGDYITDSKIRKQYQKVLDTPLYIRKQAEMGGAHGSLSVTAKGKPVIVVSDGLTQDMLPRTIVEELTHARQYQKGVRPTKGVPYKEIPEEVRAKQAAKHFVPEATLEDMIEAGVPAKSKSTSALLTDLKDYEREFIEQAGVQLDNLAVQKSAKEAPRRIFSQLSDDAQRDVLSKVGRPSAEASTSRVLLLETDEGLKVLNGSHRLAGQMTAEEPLEYFILKEQTKKAAKETAEQTAKAASEGVTAPPKALDKGLEITERRAREINKAGISPDDFASALEAQKRGAIPFPEIIRRSKELDADIGRIANLKPGTVKNAEQVEAYRQAINGFKDDVAKLEQNFLADPSQQNKAFLDSARAKLNQGIVNVEAIRSELARGLSASRIEDDISRAARNMNRVREQLPADKQLIFDRSLDQLNLASEADVARFLTEWQDASFIAKVVEYYKAALLSAPITHVRNFVGNSAYMVFDVPVRALAGGLDAVRSVGGKPRTVYASEAPRMIYSGLKALPDAVTEAMRGFRDEFYQYGARRLTIEAGQKLPAIKGTKGKIVRFPYRALSALDLFSRTIKTNMEVDALAYRLARQEGKKGLALVERVEALKRTPPADMLKLATDKADRALFLEELDGMLGSLGQMIAKYPALQFITPFYRTPVNLLREAYRLTPARLITVKSDPWLLNQSTRMEEVARTTLGSLMGGTIMWKMLDGSIDITGKAPSNASERDLFYRQGRQPYSVRIGDKWYSYREIQPFSTVAFTFSQLGQLVQTYKDKGDMDEKQIAQQVNRITTDMAQFIQDQSFFQGLANFTEAISGGSYNQGVVQAGSNYLENLFGGFIPNIVYSYQRAADPVIYQSEGFAEGIKKRIPGLAESLTPRRDVYGRPLERAGTGITRFLSPVQVSKERRDTVDDEMEKLGIAVGYPGRTAYGEALTNYEYDALVQDSGTRIYESLYRLMSTPQWNRMSEYEKENAVEKAARDSRSQSRTALFQQKKRIADFKKAYFAQGYPEVQAQVMAEKDASSGAQRPTGGAPQAPSVGDFFPQGGSAIGADDLVRQITQSNP